MRVLVAPMGAMAETSGPFSRAAALCGKLLELGHEAALCAAPDVNYHEIEGVGNYACPLPSPFGMPPTLGKRIFRVAQMMGAPQKKTVNSFEQVLFFTGAIQRKPFEKDVLAIRRAIRDFRPDVVYSEFRPAAVVAAKLETVKVAEGFSYPVQKSYASNPEYAKGVRNVLSKYRLPEIESVLDIFDWADLKIVPSSRELEPIEGGNVVFTGPFIPPARSAGTKEKNRIIAYMGTGTVSPKRLVNELSEAFGGTPYEVMIATEQLEPFERNNVVVRPRFNFGKLMTEAAAYINHGGQNSVMTGLIYGVPQIVCPGKVFERKYNARSVERIGAGEVIAAKDFRAERIKKNFSAFSRDDSYAENARRAGEKLTGLGGATKAVEALESLL